jgi:RimJ/RimL family protein N-acetyltransferase
MPVGPFADARELAAFHRSLADRPDSRVFAVAERADGRLVGSLSYMASQPIDLKVEVAAVWYTPAVQGLGVNVEAATLVIDHAFALGYQRVEWKCHADNARSRAAALRCATCGVVAPATSLRVSGSASRSRRAGRRPSSGLARSKHRLRVTDVPLRGT